jgi:hypothetical protein
MRNIGHKIEDTKLCNSDQRIINPLITKSDTMIYDIYKNVFLIYPKIWITFTNVDVVKIDRLCKYLIFGWGTRIRTLIDGVRVRCPTIERFPSRKH